MPGAAQTPSDFRALGQLSEQKQQAAKAVSRVTGKSVGTVARSKGEEVGAVIAVAQERAERRGTTVESEIEEVDERREKARKTASKLKDEHKERHTAKYIQMEGDLGVAMQRIRKVLNDAEGVKFSAEERELLTEALAKLRALLNLVDLRISGSTDIDWDAELERIS